MSRFPRFFAHRAMLLARSDGLIRAPISTENNGFFISRRYAISRVFDRCFRCAHRRQRRRFLGSLYLWHSRPNFSFATKDKRPQLIHLQHRNLFAITGRSFACSFNQALNVRREIPNVRSIPHISSIARSLGASTP